MASSLSPSSECLPFSSSRRKNIPSLTGKVFCLYYRTNHPSSFCPRCRIILLQEEGVNVSFPQFSEVGELGTYFIKKGNPRCRSNRQAWLELIQQRIIACLDAAQPIRGLSRCNETVPLSDGAKQAKSLCFLASCHASKLGARARPISSISHHDSFEAQVWVWETSRTNPVCISESRLAGLSRSVRSIGFQAVG
jgi:hypothetical protein